FASRARLPEVGDGMRSRRNTIADWNSEATMTGLRGGARIALLLAAILQAGAALSVGAGDAAPVFVLPTASGETVALDKLRGRLVYVDFWASWCAPCRRSFPWMNE